MIKEKSFTTYKLAFPNYNNKIDPQEYAHT